MTNQQIFDLIVERSREACKKGVDNEQHAAIVWAADLIKELEKAHVRYEAVRKLNPVQFAKLCQLNISSGIAFDRLVDGLAKGEFVL